MISQLSAVFLWRLLAAATSFVANLLITRMILGEYGVDQYAAIALLISIPSLIPFADLGLGSVAVNASADIDAGKDVDRAERAFAATARLLTCSAGSLVIIALLLMISGLWPAILGPAVAGIPLVSVGASLVLTGVAVNLLLSMAGRVLQGRRRNALMIAISVVGPPITLGLVLLFIWADVPAGLLGLPAVMSLIVVSVAYWWPVIRTDSESVLRGVFRTRPQRSDYSEALSVGVSGLLVSLFVAALFQLDRVALSFLGTPTDVAAYSFVAPLYVAGWALINPMAMNLWPMYRADLADGTMTRRRLWSHIGLFGAIGLAAGVGVIVLGPPIVQLMAGEDASIVPYSLYVAFAAVLVAQAVQLPSSMLLTDKGGFKLQRTPYLLAVLGKLGLTVIVTPMLGVTGPVVCTIAALILAQFPLLTYRALRRIDRES